MSSASPSSAGSVTIRVCSGADCRVDGSTDCLRLIQKQCRQQASSSDDDSIRNRIKVKSVPCIGPCGDGPNVVLIKDDNTKNRIVDMQLADELRDDDGQRSLVPPEIFGSSPTGVYQVRNKQSANKIVNLAMKTLALTSSTASTTATTDDDKDVVTSTRLWYDRPRNERLMLQRFMHICILGGLGLKYRELGDGVEMPASAWFIAATLWILSNFIMKENLLELAWKKVKR